MHNESCMVKYNMIVLGVIAKFAALLMSSLDGCWLCTDVVPHWSLHRVRDHSVAMHIEGTVGFPRHMGLVVVGLGAGCRWSLQGAVAAVLAHCYLHWTCQLEHYQPHAPKTINALL